MVDRLEARIEPSKYVAWPNGGGFQPVTLYVNGVELVELVRRVELALVGADEHAGAYLYLPARNTLLPSRNLFGEPYRHGFASPAEKSLLLQCTCGITDCWFLLAAITVDDDRVTWSSFEQFHRDWTYDLGPFVFERAAYEAALAAR